MVEIEVYEAARHSVVSPALLLLKELACIKNLTCLMMVSAENMSCKFPIHVFFIFQTVKELDPGSLHYSP